MSEDTTTTHTKTCGKSIPSKEFTYRPEIDGLRAFAVTIVIINHINPEILPSGFLGVDIFFVISGFVITGSLYGRKSNGFRDFLASFYSRRVKRLLPALVFYIITLSLLICLFNPHPDISLDTGQKALFGLSNINLYQRSVDYFDHSTAFNPFTHTWSLGVEEQFYFVFPILLWITGFARRREQGAKNLFIVLLVASAISLILFTYWYFVDSAASYFLMPSRFWELALGACIFLLATNQKNIFNISTKIRPELPTALILVVLFFPVNWSLTSTILVAFSTALILPALSNKGAINSFLTNNSIVFIGLISYSLYLWHWGILSISKWTIGISWWTLPFQIALIILMSLFSYQYIEKPFRNMSFIKTKPNFIVISCALVSVAIATISLELLMSSTVAKNGLYQGNKAGIKDPRHWDINNDWSEYISATTRECSAYPSIQTCSTMPDKKNLPTLHLIGDSHAGHLIPLLGAIHYEFGVGLKIQTAIASPLIPYKSEGIYTLSRREALDNYKTSQEILSQSLASTNQQDVILLSSRWEQLLNEQPISKKDQRARRSFLSPAGDYISFEEASEKFWLDLENFIEEAASKNKQVILISPLPAFSGSIEMNDFWSCTQEWFRPFRNMTCGFEEPKQTILHNVKHIQTRFKALEEKYTNLHVYDPFNVLCAGNICRSYIENVTTFRDDDHLSKDGALILKDSFADFIIKIGIMNNSRNI